MARLEFFFDCSSPWTYLAFHRIEALAAESGAALEWRPFLVGGVFKRVGRIHGCIDRIARYRTLPAAAPRTRQTPWNPGIRLS